ncbi:glycoside hydrolase family 16 protein [Aeromicrobium choanae]|uniref:Glycosyl hydrolases family 16 n=1 Tax=Aeromicrobium choanae TaxID=1736691 RepID=A0A1T4YS91_9ACTN|nr:glycoside hydrolase family 16 protein [Aeromicrobium choanae]SKB04135.1 Glycosyl hydrolases family 16 [Aeromicrobium choanae]
MPRDFDDDFDGPDLDRSVWLPHYLPAWSSRAASAADFEVRDSCLTLRIGPEQGLWCADDHHPPLRVSGVQSGNHSGPVGSTTGQQPFRDGLTVREEQETFWGWTPRLTSLEVVARMDLSPRSMASCWLVGRELDPRESAEICLFEVFGDTLAPGSAEVGAGLHAFRDPDVPEDFATTRLPIDVGEFHTYALDWTADEVRFSVDGEPLRTCASPPTYPMQVILAVFDFPERAPGSDPDHVPRLVVDRIRERP